MTGRRYQKMPSRLRISVIDWPTEEVLTTEVLHVPTPVTRLVSYSVPAAMKLPTSVDQYHVLGGVPML